MADAQLSVELSAKIDGLRDSFNEAIRHVNSFDKETKSKLSSVDKGFASLANDIDKAMGKASASTSKASNEVSKSLSKIAQSSATSGKSITATKVDFQGFSRILQDAAFGPAAIANNLEMAGAEIRKIGQISKESGKSIGSVLVSSLMGGGGLNLALGAVTLGLSLASFGFEAWTRVLGKNEKETKEAADINKDYAESLDAVGRGLLKGAQSASDSVVPLRSLYDATQNTTLSLKERNKAVDELQKQYPDYFGNLTNEAILAGKAEDSYKALTAAIIAKAKVSGLEDEIKENAKLLRTLEKREELNKKAQGTQKETDKLAGAIANQDADQLEAVRKTNKERLKGVDILNMSPNKEAVSASKDGDEEILTIKNTNQLLKESVQIQNQKNQALKVEEDLRKAIEGVVKKDGVEALIKDGGKTTVKKPKIVKPKIGTLGAPDDFGILGIVPKEITATPVLKIVPVLDLKGVDQAYVDLSDALDAVSDKIEQLTSVNSLVETASSAMSSGFSALGEAIASGGNVIEAFGGAFLSSFAAFLSELGAMIMKKGALLIAVGIAENFVLPGSGSKSIASGVTLLAAGAALSVVGGIGGSIANGNGAKSSSGSADSPRGIPAFASGVQNFRGGLALVGEQGPELVNLPTGASVTPSGPTKRMIQREDRGGLNISTELGIKMERLVANIRVTEKRMGRTI